MSGLFCPNAWDAQGALIAAIDGTVARLLETPLVTRFPNFKKRFEVLDRLSPPQTGYTPGMLYLLYSLAFAKRARKVCVLGTYHGLSLMALAFGAIDGGVPDVDVVGVEPDEAARLATLRASTRLGRGPTVRVLGGFPLDGLASHGEGADLLHVDVHDPVREKTDYVGAGLWATRHLPASGVLTAHDAVVPRWDRDVGALEGVLRASAGFRGPWRLCVDPTGLLVAVRR